MTTPFHQAAARATLEVVSAFTGQAVTYRRGQSSAMVTAVEGQTQVEIVDTESVAVRSRVVDWIIEASALRFDGIGRIEPQVGDVIEVERDDGKVQVFSVFEVGGEVYSWLPGGSHYRIHASHSESRE